MWYPASLCCLFPIHRPPFKPPPKWHGELCSVPGLLTSTLHLIPHVVTNNNFDPPWSQQRFGCQQQQSQDSCCQQRHTTCARTWQQLCRVAHLLPLCDDGDYTKSQETYSQGVKCSLASALAVLTEQASWGKTHVACEPARKTKPSLRLILGLAALRMFWAVFIFGFSNSSSFKVIPLKAVVLPLASGLFPSPHQPSQKVQQHESPDLLESLPFSELAGQPSRKNLPACWLSWDREGTIPHALFHHQLAARLSELPFSSGRCRVSLPFFTWTLQCTFSFFFSFSNHEHLGTSLKMNESQFDINGKGMGRYQDLMPHSQAPFPFMDSLKPQSLSSRTQIHPFLT